MKRRSERVRLKRLSQAVGEAASDVNVYDVGKASIERSYAPNYAPKLLPVVVEKPMVEVPVVKPERHILLILLAYSLGITAISINGWYSYSRGATEIDKTIFLILGVILEWIAFYLPTQTSSLWKGRRYVAATLSGLLYVFLFVFAVTNSLGFASQNMHEVSTARAERITPAVSDAQRRLDTLTASRAVECVKRGDKCRQLEKDEQLALEQLREAREKVSATADPEISAAAKLIAWASLDRFHPSQDDFAMLRLLLLTLLPQLGGLVLMVASQRS
ncbi:hypothetical protein [Bradyrhizobium cenepequi]